ncbi:MAG: rRNA maturation RNase YbeY [Candidatus Moranbacteria bacterium]|nr:rRNA maturation RNase YbeY [Candidatus Moranbacteria bacterium]
MSLIVKLTISGRYSQKIFSPDFFHEVCRDTLECSGEKFSSDIPVSVDVVFLSSPMMRVLNRERRGKDSVTDVLSFSHHSVNANSGVRFWIDEKGNRQCFLGQIFLCSSYIRDAAVADGVTFPKEMVYIFSHGVLHLLGFYHGPEMFGIQDKVCDRFLKRVE